MMANKKLNPATLTNDQINEFFPELINKFEMVVLKYPNGNKNVFFKKNKLPYNIDNDPILKQELKIILGSILNEK